IRAIDPHLAPHVLLQELGGREEVEVEVLLDERQRSRVRQAAQRRGLRPHASADLAQRQAVETGIEAYAPRVLDEGEVLVVDGDGDGLLVREGAGRLLLRRVGAGDRERRRYGGAELLELHFILPFWGCPPLNGSRRKKG